MLNGNNMNVDAYTSDADRLMKKLMVIIINLKIFQ
jgi:hypothetical protein